MINIPGIGAIIRNEQNQVFMVFIDRGGMKRWELPTKLSSNNESLFLTLFKCIEQESNFTLTPKINKPICYAINESKINGLTFFGIFYECSYKLNTIKPIELDGVNNRTPLADNLSQDIIKSCFVEWKSIPKPQMHPQHYKILELIDASPLPFFTILSDADEELKYYFNNDITLKPYFLKPNEIINMNNMLSSENESQIVNIENHIFEVSFTFPGEVRDHTVFPIVESLQKKLKPNMIFYDNYYTSQLAKPNLDTILQGIYTRSKLVVVVLSSLYNTKEWCGIEFRAVRDMIKKRRNEKILLIKTDTGDVDGIFSIDGYIDATKYSTNELVNFIMERLTLIKKNEA